MTGTVANKSYSQKRVVPLRVRKRFVETLLGLPDNNEKALTYALGYMIANSELLRRRLFKHALGSVSPGKNIFVDVERAIGESRHDIQINIDGKH